MWIIVLLWIVLIIWKCEYIKDVPQNALSKSNAQVLKGICALEIVLGHLGIATESIFLFPNRKAGILFVGIFFLLSGYGLVYSTTNKQDYLRGFLIRRIPKIIMPAYIIYAFGIIMSCIVNGNVGSLSMLIDIPAIFYGINWYIWELAIMYILFYICVKNGNIEKMHWCVLISSIVFIMVAFALDIDNPWYGSTLCFWLGIFYFTKKDKLQERLKGKKFFLYFILGSIAVICSIGLFFVYGEKSFIGNVVGRNLASLCFAIIVIVMLQRFRIGNEISVYLGNYSFEIFLFHPIVINICRPYIENDFIFSICVILFSIIFSALYKNCVNLIRTICRRYFAI